MTDTRFISKREENTFIFRDTYNKEKEWYRKMNCKMQGKEYPGYQFSCHRTFKLK